MCIKWYNLCCKINKLNQIIHRAMINKNSSSCNRAISFKSVFTNIGVRSFLARAKFSKRSGVGVFTLFSVLVTSIFKGYLNLYRFFKSTEGKTLLL